MVGPNHGSIGGRPEPEKDAMDRTGKDGQQPRSDDGRGGFLLFIAQKPTEDKDHHPAFGHSAALEDGLPLFLQWLGVDN